jgi:hypothetical protein
MHAGNPAAGFTNFEPYLDAFYLSDNKAIYTGIYPYAIPRADSSLDFAYETHYKYALFTEDTNLKIDIYPIVINDSSDLNGNRNIYSFLFHKLQVVNDSTFLFFYYLNNYGNSKKEDGYIAVFKLRNKKIQFERYLKNRIPDVYLNTPWGRYFAANFNCFDYPFYIPTMGTQIMDLQIEKDYKFKPGFYVDFSNRGPDFFDQIDSGKVDYPLYNLGLFKDMKRHELYLLSAANNSIYLTIFNQANMKISKTIDLRKIGVSYKAGMCPNKSYVYYNNENGLFYIEDSDGIIRSVPMELIVKNK